MKERFLSSLCPSYPHSMQTGVCGHPSRVLVPDRPSITRSLIKQRINVALSQSINHPAERSRGTCKQLLVCTYLRRARKEPDDSPLFRIAPAHESCPDECHRPHFAHVLAQSTAASLDARYTKQTQHRRHSMKVIGMRAYPPKGTHPFSVAHVPQNGEHGKRMKRAQTAPVVSLRLGPATSPF